MKVLEQSPERHHLLSGRRGAAIGYERNIIRNRGPLRGERQVVRNRRGEVVRRAVYIPTREHVALTRGIRRTLSRIVVLDALRLDRAATVAVEGDGMRCGRLLPPRGKRNVVSDSLGEIIERAAQYVPKISAVTVRR